MKFKNGLIKEVKEQEREREEQQRLKNKYKIDEDVKIVEKTNMFKFIIRIGIRLWHVALNVVVYILALVGALALVYPNSRREIVIICLDLFGQLEALLK